MRVKEYWKRSSVFFILSFYSVLFSGILVSVTFYFNSEKKERKKKILLALINGSNLINWVMILFFWFCTVSVAGACNNEIQESSSFSLSFYSLSFVKERTRRISKRDRELCITHREGEREGNKDKTQFADKCSKFDAWWRLRWRKLRFSLSPSLHFLLLSLKFFAFSILSNSVNLSVISCTLLHK